MATASASPLTAPDAVAPGRQLAAAFFYAQPQFRSTGLSNNTRQCAAVATAAGIPARSVCLTELCLHAGDQQDWHTWMAVHQPRAVVLGALVMPMPDLEQLAVRYPDTLWIQRVHSNLAWFQNTVGDMRGVCTLLSEVVPSQANVRFALVCPDDAARFEAAGVSAVCLPNVICGDIADTPRDLPEATTLHLSAMFAIRWMKHYSGHVLAASTLNRLIHDAGPTSRHSRAILHVQLERTDNPKWCEYLKQLANICRLPLAVEPYRDHADFCTWLRDTVDIGLQLSMTESFNYVALEHMAQGIPVVTSHAIPWSPWRVRYEDTIAAAAATLDILGDYRACSERALDAARAVAHENSTRFVRNLSALLSGDL